MEIAQLQQEILEAARLIDRNKIILSLNEQLLSVKEELKVLQEQRKTAEDQSLQTTKQPEV